LTRSVSGAENARAMSIIVSAFALGFLVMGLFLLWLGGAALAGRLRAIGRWVRVEGRVVEILKETRMAARTAQYAAGNAPARPTLQGPQDFYFPVYEYLLPGGTRGRVRSPLGAEHEAAYAIGDGARLLVDPQGKVEPLVDARGGVWFMPLGMLAAGAVALGAAALLGYLVARKLGFVA
jgi:hypothetical protein